MSRLLSPVVLVVLLMAGCTAPPAGPAEPSPGAPSDAAFIIVTRAAADASPVSVQVNPERYGFEPSVRIAPDGTIYVAAAKGFGANAADGLASPVWYSKDHGMTWSRLEALQGVRKAFYGIEGDLAVDAGGSVFFVDTYGPDNTITVWESDGRWRSTRPVQGTSGLDDRPWLAAHGDGVLYMLGNSGSQLPDPRGGAPFGEWSAITFYASQDAGLTWSTGHPFPGSDRCGIVASPFNDVEVLVGCVSRPPEDKLGRAYIFHSTDRGKTFEEVKVADQEGPRAEVYPTVGFGSVGMRWFSWAEAIDGGTVLRLARHNEEHGWQVATVPLGRLHIATPWLAASPNGPLGIAFYGTEDGPGPDRAWRPYLWSADPSSHLLEGTLTVLDEVVKRGTEAPLDFLQAAAGPDGSFSVVYQRDGTPDRSLPVEAIKPDRQAIMHVRVPQRAPAVV